MGIKDILLQIDVGAAYPARLDLAVGLALCRGAHLVGLCVFDVRLVPGAGFRAIDREDSMALPEWQFRLRAEALEAAAKLEAGFRERLRRDGLEGEWRLVEGDAAATIGLHARYADLTVLGQEDPDDQRISGWTAVLQQVLLSSGRPLLIVPYAGQFAHVGRRVLVGWNARREAARAVNDALPLIEHAEVVTVLADTAIRAKDLDESAARKAKEDAERLLANRTDAIEVAEAQVQLAQAIAQLQDERIVEKLFSSLADRYKTRPGGYCRVLKAGVRYGDAANMAVIELVDRDPSAKGQDSGPRNEVPDEDQQAA